MACNIFSSNGCTCLATVDWFTAAVEVCIAPSAVEEYCLCSNCEFT